MLAGGGKSKSAMQSGYFSDTFSRVMEGEAYSDQVKMRRQSRLKEAQKNIGKPFVPSSGEKKWYFLDIQSIPLSFIQYCFTVNLLYALDQASIITVM